MVKNIGISGFIDILFITFIIYSLLVWLKKTQARFILTGILIIGAIYLFSQQFNLIITSIILKALFAVILVALLIIFQKELRQLFEQVALWSLKKCTVDNSSKLISYSAVEILTRCLDDFEKDKIGALVVLPAKDKIDGFLDGGIELEGRVSEELIKSLFDPHSTGHDGVVFIENGIVEKFSCHLPLSLNFSQLQKKGTRHDAALGLAEETDALCLVVSEERGKISIARNSNLMKVTSEQLQVHLQDYYSEIIPDTGNSRWKEYFGENNREKALALLVSVVLWFVFVHESRLVYRNFTLPINNIVVSSEL